VLKTFLFLRKAVSSSATLQQAAKGFGFAIFDETPDYNPQDRHSESTSA